MPKRVGTTQGLINWDKVIADIQHHVGDHNTVTSVVDRSEAEAVDDQELLSSYREVISTWEKAGYDLKQIEWWDYYPGLHFDIEVQQVFERMFNIKPRRVFISKVMPGNMVPYHWDVEDHEKEWLKEDTLVRYVCFIDPPKFGHVMILEDNAFHNVERGEIYQWDNYRSHHAGVNGGEGPQYLFHFLGSPND
jgi:hypothetical protein